MSGVVVKLVDCFFFHFSNWGDLHHSHPEAAPLVSGTLVFFPREKKIRDGKHGKETMCRRFLLADGQNGDGKKRSFTPPKSNIDA